MKVLVIGQGGREHSLVWKIAKSPNVKKIYCAPGNAGISKLAKCIDINANDINGLVKFAKENKINLTVVGPEEPLSLGIVDEFEKEGLKIFGSSKEASRLESSKIFAKKIMHKYNVPTGKAEFFNSYEDAKNYIEKEEKPVVIKADGLAAGKGVFICKTKKEALEALNKICIEKAFGSAGENILIEEFLEGEEASFIALVDGDFILPLPTSQDHKRIFDDDKGPNTGGMGAYSPAPIINSYLHDKIMQEIMFPIVKGMKQEKIPFKGVLYAGLIIKDGLIKVLEFNVRFGDPEAQPLLLRIKSDIVPLLEACINGNLNEQKIELDKRASICVVLASGGYPSSYEKGFEIKGIEEAEKEENVMVFHAGTKIKNDKIVNNGGRVLGVTALGDGIKDAIKKAYSSVSKISWNNFQYRKDIAKKAFLHIDKKKDVLIAIGSLSDYPVMRETIKTLEKFNIPFLLKVSSAHRSPDKTKELAINAKEKGFKVIIAAAGLAAHLAGAFASYTTLPVIGIPMTASELSGLDALYSTVQMPAGIPVATVAIGKAGAVNAGVLAAQILGISNDKISKTLEEYKKELALKVEKSSMQIEEILQLAKKLF